MKLGTKPIGPSWWSEMRAAGLAGLPISAGEDADIGGAWDSLTTQQQDAVRAVYAEHDPTRPDPDVVQEQAEDADRRGKLVELAGLLDTWDTITLQQRWRAVWLIGRIVLAIARRLLR